LTIGNSYAIEASGGPYTVHDPPDAGEAYYVFELDGSGQIGLAYTDAAQVYYLTLPSIGLLAEAVDAYRGRVYFIATGTSVNYRVPDTDYGDNAGTLGYILSNATIVGRALDIYGAVVNNVCAP